MTILLIRNTRRTFRYRSVLQDPQFVHRVLYAVVLASITINDALGTDDIPFVELRRCKIDINATYAFDFEDRRDTGSPVFFVSSAEENLNELLRDATRFYVFSNSKVDYCADTLRWDVTSESLFISYIGAKSANPQWMRTSLERYPAEALRPNLDLKDALDSSHPQAQPLDPGARWPVRPPGFSDLTPVASTMGRWQYAPLKPGETGYKPGEATYGWKPKHTDHIPTVEYDIRAVDDWHVELLMTADGRPSVWRLEASPDVPRHEWRWMRLAEYPSTIEGPFLWMQDPQYVVAEREGQWCVIGPIDAEKPEVRPIVAKESGQPLYLVEDVHAGKDYFRIGGKLLDDQGRAVDTIDQSKSPDDQLREVISQVVARRQ